jgi:hypothetical protein
MKMNLLELQVEKRGSSYRAKEQQLLASASESLKLLPARKI